MSTSTPHSQSSIAVDLPADAPAWAAELVEKNQELRAENDRLRDRVEDLEDDQNDHRETTARERAEDRKRISDLEDQLADVEAVDRPQGSTEEDPAADRPKAPQTSLERTVSLPAEMIDTETANVQRAVFLARDVHDYTRSVPAGRMISAGDLGRVLKAGTGCKGHSQTVDRVMTILDDLGGDGVEIVERRGERRVVFSEDLAGRLEAMTRPDPGDDHGVVTGGTV